jgi:hypothetical protein
VGIINIHDLETHMQIKTQPIKEAIEIKNSGIAFDVYNNGSKRIGDLAVTKNGLIWNNGNAQRSKGVTVKWDDFITWMQSRTQTQPQSQIQAQPRTAPKAKAAVAAKPRSTVDAKKPAAKIAASKITASAKTARKKAH